MFENKLIDPKEENVWSVEGERVVRGQFWMFGSHVSTVSRGNFDLWGNFDHFWKKNLNQYIM